MTFEPIGLQETILFGESRNDRAILIIWLCSAEILCSMIDIGNHRLGQLAFDRCHSIDLTFNYPLAAHRSLMKQFYSRVMPRVCHDIQSLTINFYHISSMKTFIEKNCNVTLPNLTHFKIVLGTKRGKTGIPYTIGNLIRLIGFF
jgi:hypothetical protein